MQSKLTENLQSRNFKSKIWQNDIIIAFCIISILAILIIPIPTFLLDILITLNIALSLGTLLIVIYIHKPFEFSVFPTLLLIMTLFRLGINISSTRLILLNGDKFDANIILAFGDFVVRGNYIVGAIIFIILIAVQFIVIIKGASRVSEVAARFTLDGMPGKQMSVDSDLASGLITEQQALERRKEIRGEVDFYGAMDGASKFVQGDVRVGLIITLINILGGLAVGVIMHGMTLKEAFDVFFILTVGDGLSAQLPSLILSTATGIIVTRSISDRSLGNDIYHQLQLSPKAVIITGIFLLFLAIIPGFPTLILIVMGASIFSYGIFLNNNLNSFIEKETSEKGKNNLQANFSDWIHIDPIEIELGYQLVPFVDDKNTGNILDRIRMIRKSLAMDLGLLVPPIRVRDNLKLNSDQYSIKIRGVEVAQGIINVKKLLAIPSLRTSEIIEGEETIEPAFKSRAIWIYPELKEEAEQKFYSVIDPISILTTHLTEIIKDNAHDILGRQEVKDLLESLREKYPNLVEEVLKVAGLAKVQKILHLFLNEQISIRNLTTILEVICDYADKLSNLEQIYNLARERLGRQLVHQYRSEDGVLRVYTLSIDLEKMIEESIQETETSYISTLSLDKINQIFLLCLEKYKEASQNGFIMVILVSKTIRFFISNILKKKLPSLGVLAYNEIPSDISLERLGFIDFNNLEDPSRMENIN